MKYPWLYTIYEELRGRIQTNKLHHGLLFLSDKGAGTETLLHELANSLVCESRSACRHCKGCSLFAAHSHPDVKEIISDKPSIGVDLIRGVSDFVTTTAQLMGNKVIIINDIDKMTESASNSLLKTLEEPTSNTFLLLSSNNPDGLLATIKSRCEKIRIALPSQETAMSWLANHTEMTITNDGLQAYSGSPILYLQALSEKQDDYHTFIEDLNALADKSLETTSLAQKWQKNAQQALKWVYQWSVNRYAEGLNANQSNQHLLHAQSICDECVKLNAKAGQAGINKVLLLQRVFMLIQTRGS